MTRKIFELTAKVLNERFNAPGVDVVEREVILSIARGFVREFQQHNPRFNEERFYNAITAEGTR